MLYVLSFYLIYIVILLSILHTFRQVFKQKGQKNNSQALSLTADKLNFYHIAASSLEITSP